MQMHYRAGLFAALFSVGLVGCGGNKKSSKYNTTTAAATSGTSGTTSGTAGSTSGTSGTTSGTTPGSTPGGTPGQGAPDDHGNTPQTASAVTLSQALSGTLEVAGDVDWFSVDLVGGTAYTIKTQNLGAGMDSVLGLFDDQGNQIAVNDDVSQNDLSSSIDFTPPADGTFFFAVIHADPAGTGDYEVLADLQGAAPPPPADDHGNDLATATALTMGTAASGVIEVGGDLDVFAIDLTDGTDYTFATSNLQNGMNTVLALFDDQGNQIAANDDVSATDVSSRIDFTATATATFYLGVAHADPAATGSYDLLADLATATPPPPADDHGDDAASATPLALATPTAGITEVGTDMDWFAVDLVAGMEYEFTAVVGASPASDPVLTLLDTNGSRVLDQNDDSQMPNPGNILDSRIPNDPAINFVAPADGTYYLVVEHANPVTFAGNEDYVLQAMEIQVTPPANAASLVSAMHADVDGSFGVSAGDTITLTFSEDVTIVTIQPAPLPTIDPATELELAVASDSFGQGASLVAGPGATEVTVTLGTDPSFKLSGSFDPAALTMGSPSGLSVLQTTTISTASNGLPVVGGPVDVDSPLTAGFQPGATLVTARGVHTATVLDDGRVLVTGGLTDGQNGPTYVSRSEIYDAGVWTETSDASLGGIQGDMLAGTAGGQAFRTVRYRHSATKLASGEVLVAGGVGVEALDAQNQAIQGDLRSAFVFDPATNQFTPTATPLTVPRSAHYSTLLPNGQVLISGGYNSNLYGASAGGTLPVAELYDPFSRSFSTMSQTGVDMVLPREAGTATVVGNKVLHVGGHLYGATQANPQVRLLAALGSEAFDMTANAFAADADLVDWRRYHTADLLSNGDLLVVAGDMGAAGQTDSVERYDAANGTFSAVGNLTTARARHVSAMVGDDVLVIGGVATDPSGALVDVATGELYNTQFNVVEVYQMQSPRNSHTAVTMPNGSVMVIGGFTGGTSLLGTNGTAVGGAEIFVLP